MVSLFSCFLACAAACMLAEPLRGKAGDILVWAACLSLKVVRWLHQLQAAVLGCLVHGSPGAALETILEEPQHALCK